MAERDDAIEAGAAASYERHRAERPDLGLKPWAESGPNMRRSELAESATHYDAMAPLIQAGIDDVEAKAWHRGWHDAAVEIAEAIQSHSGKSHPSYAHAAEIARKVGGAS